MQVALGRELWARSPCANREGTKGGAGGDGDKSMLNTSFPFGKGLKLSPKILCCLPKVRVAPLYLNFVIPNRGLLVNQSRGAWPDRDSRVF